MPITLPNGGAVDRGSRYASPAPPIGEYLTGLDSAFVPSPDSPGSGCAKRGGLLLIPQERTTAIDRRAAMIKITDAIQQHPTGTFLAFVAFHTVVWTVL